MIFFYLEPINSDQKKNFLKSFFFTEKIYEIRRFFESFSIERQVKLNITKITIHVNSSVYTVLGVLSAFRDVSFLLSFLIGKR
ncbi:hypothetical protein LEP1GSC074_1530 [Leptospira noguchii str. Hook]|nr:hypothetical protein LEP1GSC074_1530 [Leptospira noguchii str. Hook]